MSKNGSIAIAHAELDPQAVAKPREKSSEGLSWKTRLKRVPTPVWETLVLTPALLFTAGLFLLPTVFYALPTRQVRADCEY